MLRKSSIVLHLAAAEAAGIACRYFLVVTTLMVLAALPTFAQNGSAAQGGRSFTEDDLTGVTLTDQQKTKIEQIHTDMKARMDVVLKDQALLKEQKDAMLVGYQRIEWGKILAVLTREQQAEVRQKILARRGEERQASAKKLGPQPSAR